MSALIAAAAVAATLTGGPLMWTAPGPVDTQPIDAITCPATTLCVAVDRAGGVLWSTDPAGGAGRAAWHRAVVDGGNELTGVSCPTTALCVAVDAVGNAVTSANPTAGRAAWTVAPIDSSTTQNNTDNAGAVLVRGVSCPSTTLCVAVDAAGNALISTNPTGGSTAWGPLHIDTNTSYGCNETGPPALTCQPPLVGIACPSVAQCVAVDFSGNVLSTSTPGTPVPWVSTPTPGGLHSLWGVSCATTTFCAAVDGLGGHVITFNPGATSSLLSRALPYSLYGIWCQTQSLCLASAETDGGISGLVGSVRPTTSTWSLSPVGAVNAVACPPASPLCIAADDEGNIAAGETTSAITAALRGELLAARHLPSIAALDRTHRATFTFTTPIAGQVTVAWTATGRANTAPVATATHLFKAPGTARLTLDLNDAGAQLFGAATRPVRLIGTATFTAGTGLASVAQKLTFRHPPKRKRRHH